MVLNIWLTRKKSLFLDCEIMKVEDFSTYLRGIYVYKLFRESALPTTAHVYNSRGNDWIQPIFHRLTSTQRYLSYVCPIVWNAITSQIRDSVSLKILKKYLKFNLF